MVRILLEYMLPLLLPTAAYVTWVWYFRKRAEELGGEAPEVTRGGLFWSLVIGLVLVIIGLITLAVTEGVGPGTGAYQSPQLKDGRIIPPEFK